MILLPTVLGSQYSRIGSGKGTPCSLGTLSSTSVMNVGDQGSVTITNPRARMHCVRRYDIRFKAKDPNIITKQDDYIERERE